MNLTRINVADAQPGMLASLEGGKAIVTKVRRPRGADFLRITFVDDLGSIFSRKYMDGTDASPSNWTLDIVL